jgi:hypothetical protein
MDWTSLTIAAALPPAGFALRWLLRRQEPEVETEASTVSA